MPAGKARASAVVAEGIGEIRNRNFGMELKALRLANGIPARRMNGESEERLSRSRQFKFYIEASVD